MVLLRALTTALDSTRFAIMFYQTFSEVIFPPSANDVIGATFQQLSLLPQTWRLGVPLRANRSSSFTETRGTNHPLPRQLSVLPQLGMDPTGNLIWKGTLQTQKFHFDFQESVTKLIFIHSCSSFFSNVWSIAWTVLIRERKNGTNTKVL